MYTLVAPEPGPLFPLKGAPEARTLPCPEIATLKPLNSFADSPGMLSLDSHPEYPVKFEQAPFAFKESMESNIIW
jgi:hypothetical protein